MCEVRINGRRSRCGYDGLRGSGGRGGGLLGRRWFLNYEE